MDPTYLDMNKLLKKQLSQLSEKIQRGMLKPITPVQLDNLSIPNKTAYLSKLFGGDITEPNNLAALHKLIAQPGVCWIKASLNSRDIIFNHNATTGDTHQEMKDEVDDICDNFLGKNEWTKEKEKRMNIKHWSVIRKHQEKEKRKKNLFSGVVKKWHTMSKQDASDFLRLIKTYKPKDEWMNENNREIKKWQTVWLCV